MTVAYEIVDSMSGSVTVDQGSASVTEFRRRFVVGHFASFHECRSAVEPYLPVYSNEGPLGIAVRQQLAIQGIGNRYYDITATYRTLGPTSPGNDNNDPEQGNYQYIPGSMAWDTTGNTEHITQAIAQTSFPAEAADFEGAINVSGDAVQGLDVVRPSMRYSETWIMPIGQAMACGYLSSVYKLTGTVNAGKFRCFDAGEALFVGARGQWSDDAPYVSVTFEFEARPNDTSWKPWGSYSGAATTKKGWEHVWIRYESGENANTLIKKPIAAYKSQVYREGDWSPLNIGAMTVAAPRRPSAPQLGNMIANGLLGNGIPGGVTA